jgi:hypothetical protein
MRWALLVACLVAGCDAPRPCTLVGRWSGVVPLGRWANTRVYLDFADGGGYQFEVGSAIFGGTWRTAAEEGEEILTVTDEGCSRGEVEGRYRLTFESDCSDVSIGIKQDDCVGRYQVLNGLVLQPSPQ